MAADAQKDQEMKPQQQQAMREAVLEKMWNVVRDRFINARRFSVLRAHSHGMLLDKDDHALAALIKEKWLEDFQTKPLVDLQLAYEDAMQQKRGVKRSFLSTQQQQQQLLPPTQQQAAPPRSPTSQSTTATVQMGLSHAARREYNDAGGGGDAPMAQVQHQHRRLAAPGHYA